MVLNICTKVGGRCVCLCVYVCEYGFLLKGCGCQQQVHIKFKLKNLLTAIQARLLNSHGLGNGVLILVEGIG